MKHLFYQPNQGYVADIIPFYDEGRFHLFYLHDYRNVEKYGEGISWNHISTDDFLHYEDHGVAIPHGTKEAPDLCVFTGSVIKAEGQYHIFYTGSNYHRIPSGACQVILHAVSKDLSIWEKDQDFALAPTEEIDPIHFRDPFVYYDETEKLYKMILICRSKDGHELSGRSVRYTSSNLKDWTYEKVFWVPDMYINQECPDLFRIGEWYYYVFSEYSDTYKTHYVMSKSPDGPWQIPANPDFSSRAFYAAKTAFDGEKHYLFGWIPTRTDNHDDGLWQWGGSLCVLELKQHLDGTLGCILPQSIEVAKNSCPRLSTITSQTTLSRIDGRIDTPFAKGISGTIRIDAEIQFVENTREFGISMGRDFSQKQGYRFSFHPDAQMVQFGTLSFPCRTQGLSSPISLIPGTPVRLSIVIEDDIVVLYCQDAVICSRVCNAGEMDFAFYVIGGSAQIDKITVFDYSSATHTPVIGNHQG